MPRVTVLIAVHNGERYIREAIDSILAQTLEDFELLIVNDGSTDATRDLVLSYSDARIRLVDNDRNVGLPTSLNRGLRLAKGRYIARLDADDISEPDRLAAQVSFLHANPDVAMVGSWYSKIDGEGNTLGERRLPTTCTDIRWALLFYCPFVHSAVMLNRSWLDRIGEYDEAFSYALDFELWRRIAARFPVANLARPLVRYRVHRDSMTNTYGPRAGEGDDLRIERLVRLLDSSGWPENNKALFVRLRSLISDVPSSIDLKKLDATIQSMLRLQARFCQVYRLETTDCRRHRKGLLYRISRRLIGEGHRFPDHLRRRDAVRLLRTAARLSPRSLYTSDAVELTAKLLVGPTGIKWYRSFTSRAQGSGLRAET